MKPTSDNGRRNLRAVANRSLDAIHGGRQATAVRQIESVMGSEDVASKFTEHALRRILDHAARTTHTYREFPPNTPLHEFPVIDKAFVRENTDQMLSSGYNRDHLVTASTSGSTGTPLTVFQDPHKRLIRSAEAVYFGRSAGFHLGTRLYNLKVWSGRNHQSPWIHWLRNTRPVDVLQFGNDELQAFTTTLSQSSAPVSIIAYSSALEQLARHLASYPFNRQPSVQAVIAQSEALSQIARNRLSQQLGATVVTRYGTEEAGIIGQQDPTGTAYSINRAGVHVEILDFNTDTPAEPGTLGRIVVTDFHNAAMPMIRYDTGDIGTYSTTPSGDVDRTHLETVEGRMLDQIFDTQTRRISSFIFYKYIWKYSQIRQFQIRQTATARYTLRLSVAPAFDSEQSVADDFRNELGADATLIVEYVDEVPPTGSGKRKQVVQERQLSEYADGMKL